MSKRGQHQLKLGGETGCTANKSCWQIMPFCPSSYCIVCRLLGSAAFRHKLLAQYGSVVMIPYYGSVVMIPYYELTGSTSTIAAYAKASLKVKTGAVTPLKWPSQVSSSTG